ncbi:MAG: hypothetical protein HQL05_02185 [Nitrospirae bacterium]|uniref:hypothetical protein n=1 Tax=Candidatus Magnetobacterium casense TaxID=1455061 RepID=UPI0005911FB8|nr:hypothetical protein [Candidatus Magnetobacterium casensis]MBF0336619.1 hypothetical protein [Nitrospirota bacterium]
MKASIHDKQVLSNLKPLDILMYLRATGWHEVKTVPDKWTVLIKEGDFEIILPLTNQYSDFVLRMLDMLKTLEVVEERSQFEIVNDLNTASADIIRLRVSDAESTDGTISIEEGSKIVQSSRDLIMASACAAIEKRAIYQTRKPTRVMEYLKKVRLGQTEHGSYVITVISRVVPDLKVQTPEMEEPFERQVVITLAKAISAANHAASSAVAKSSFQDFQAVVNEGVSANLCDAIYGLASGGESDKGLEISFSWSRSRPLNDPNIQSKIVFLPDSIPIFKEAARLFRDTNARDDFELCGPVVKLERAADGATMGKVTILAFVDEQPKKIQMEMIDTDYQKALQAHGNQDTIYCMGSLTREGRSFILKNPHNIAIGSSPE